MHPIQQNQASRASVYVALQNTVSGGFLAHVAHRLFHGDEAPFLVELGAEMAAQARFIANRAPPNVLYPVIASIRLPRSVALIELPDGEALYIETDGGRVCVCALQTNGHSVSFKPITGVMSPPAEVPMVDWNAVDTGAWSSDEAADVIWRAWAEASIEAAPLIGTSRARGRKRDRLLRNYVLPGLVMLALITSPLADAEPTFWCRVRDADEG